MTDYTLGLVPVTEQNRASFEGLYLNHYGIDADVHKIVRSPEQVCQMMQDFWSAGWLSHYSCAMTRSGTIAAAMGILQPKDEPGLYVFSHLVTHAGHRQKGLAKRVLYTGTELLKGLGADVIRNHKRMNVIPSRYFDEMGFHETHIPMDDRIHPEYKLRYQWTRV